MREKLGTMVTEIEHCMANQSVKKKIRIIKKRREREKRKMYAP